MLKIKKRVPVRAVGAVGVEGYLVLPPPLDVPVDRLVRDVHSARFVPRKLLFHVFEAKFGAGLLIVRHVARPVLLDDLAITHGLYSPFVIRLVCQCTTPLLKTTSVSLKGSTLQLSLLMMSYARAVFTYIL